MTVAEQVARLKAVYERWLLDYRRVKQEEPEIARHLAEALLDLQLLISRLQDAAGPPPLDPNGDGVDSNHRPVH